MLSKLPGSQGKLHLGMDMDIYVCVFEDVAVQ